MTDIRAALDAIGRGWTGMDGTFSMKNEDAQIVAGALTTLAASPPKADAIDKALAQGFTDGWNAALAASSPMLDDGLRGYIAAALAEWNQQATGAQGWPAMAALEVAFGYATLAASPPLDVEVVKAVFDRWRYVTASTRPLLPTAEWFAAEYARLAKTEEPSDD